MNRYLFSSAETSLLFIYIWTLWLYRSQPTYQLLYRCPVGFFPFSQAIACNTDQCILIVGKSLCYQSTMPQKGGFPNLSRCVDGGTGQFFFSICWLKHSSLGCQSAFKVVVNTAW